MTRSDYTSNVRLVTCFEITGFSNTAFTSFTALDTLDRDTYNVVRA
jgi:hypothetical protein